MGSDARRPATIREENDTGTPFLRAIWPSRGGGSVRRLQMARNMHCMKAVWKQVKLVNTTSKSIFTALLGLWLGLGVGWAEGETEEKKGGQGVEIFPLEDLQPGMVGEWHTVVRGTEVEVFPLEILEVIPNFIAPRRAAIIARATDPQNILSGPVSGMSGSPVYIEGRLVGAYAYGFSWPREQAIIGITPIEDMLEVWTLEDQPGDGSSRASVGRSGMDPRSLFPEAMRDDPWAHWAEDFFDHLPTRQARSGGLGGETPLLMQTGGFSPQVREAFAPFWAARGIQLGEGAAGGTAAGAAANWNLDPGAAVAAVLLDGDFNVAATGTVTHRDGDRLLAFGHPFLGIGQTSIPMAPAKVVTVVQRLNLSFKLSSTGPVMGSIGQDRLSAISGRIGHLVPTTRYSIRRPGNGGEEVLEGNLFRDQSLSPMIAAMMLMQTLATRMDFEEEQTLRLKTTVHLEGIDEPLVYEEIATGGNGPFQLGFGHLFRHARLVNNPFSEVALAKLDFSIEKMGGEKSWRLVEIRTDRLDYSPGDTIRLQVRLEGFRGEEQIRELSVPIPGDLSRGETLTLLVGDAAFTQNRHPGLRGSSFSLTQFLDRERLIPVNDSLYVMLVRPQQGVEMAGVEASDLPASVYASLVRTREGTLLRTLSERLILTQRHRWPGEVRGSFRRTLTLQ